MWITVSSHLLCLSEAEGCLGGVGGDQTEGGLGIEGNRGAMVIRDSHCHLCLFGEGEEEEVWGWRRPADFLILQCKKKVSVTSNPIGGKLLFALILIL